MLELVTFKTIDVPVKSIVKNGNFNDGFSWVVVLGGSLSVVNNVITLVGDGSSSSVILKNYNDINVSEVDDILYVSIEIKTNPSATKTVIQFFSSEATMGSSQLNKSDGSIKRQSLSYKLGQTYGHLALGVRLYFTDVPSSANKETKFTNLLSINLTQAFGKGNEPSVEQMDKLLEQYPNSWFDSTKNIFNAKHFMTMYFNKMKELNNAIIELGGTP